MESCKIENFITNLHDDKHTLTYEICPQKNGNFTNMLNMIKENGLADMVDAFVVPDSPLAKLKYSSILASIKIQDILKVPSLCTISMRDKNSIALQSEILGLNEFDVRIFLAITGDKISNGDQLQAKGVFEGNSQYLLEIIERLNQNTDINHLPLQTPALKQIYGFCVSNSYANDMKNIKNKLFLKIAHGAKAIITQPIYDIKTADILQEFVDEINQTLDTNAVLIFGFFPILSYRNASFLCSHLPGVYVPRHILDSLKKCNGDVNKENQTGLATSYEIFTQLRQKYNNMHFMNHNGFSNALKIITGKF